MENETLYQALKLSRGQKITEDNFQLCVDCGYRINNINLSSEVSFIIKEAGRLCDLYASDLYYDLKTLFNDLEGENSVLFEQDTYQWVVGIRDLGVDHDNFIVCGLEGNYDMEKRYRAIYEISIEPEPNSRHWYNMTLSKINIWQLENNYNKLKEEQV